MKSTLASIKARFDTLDRGVRRAGWARLPRASLAWAAVMITTAAVTWNGSVQLRAGGNRAVSWSAQQTLDGHLWRAATATILTQDL